MYIFICVYIQKKIPLTMVKSIDLGTGVRKQRDQLGDHCNKTFSYTIMKFYKMQHRDSHC